MEQREVSAQRYHACVDRRACLPRRAPIDMAGEIPGQCDGGILRARGFERGLSAACTTRDRLRPTMPANCVVYGDARRFCEVQGGDLPTEEQWQRAANVAAASEAAFIRANANLLDPVATRTFAALLSDADMPATDDNEPFLRDAEGPSRDLAPSGVANLYGNVAEWVRTTQAIARADELLAGYDPANGDMRRIRGGHFLEGDLRYARSGVQSGGGGDCFSSSQVGFRCAFPTNASRLQTR
jgi:formylglycine-generating enzyme required for sulfatase activity